MIISIGIDIGVTGAIAVIGSCTQVKDMPTVKTQTGRRIQGKELIHILRNFIPVVDFAIVTMEDVRARPSGNGGTHGNSMHSQASMIGSRRAIEAVLDIMGITPKFVQPATWKKKYGLLKKDKDVSRHRALELFPEMAKSLSRKLDHNRAESLLIAHYGMTS